MTKTNDPLLPLTAQIVSAHVGHNTIGARDLPALISSVYQALSASLPREAQPTAASPAKSAAPARAAGKDKSVFDDHLVCLECGLSMKMLKRHLQTVHNMSPAQYRAKFRLPGDHPMVAREYAELRSSLAKESGLGKRPVPGGR
jgi:predicted transcriptional regulator